MIFTASHKVFGWKNQREWDGCVMLHVGGEKGNCIESLWVKSERKGILGIQSRRWENNIYLALKKQGSRAWTVLPHCGKAQRPTFWKS